VTEPGRHTIPLAVAVGISIAWLHATQHPEIALGVLYLTPALLLGLVLLSGRYPGEELLAKAAAPQLSRPRRRRRAAGFGSPRAHGTTPRSSPDRWARAHRRPDPRRNSWRAAQREPSSH
jgi:hypothetical protein